MSGTGRLEIDVPQGWFALDLDPATAATSAQRMVDGWTDRRPELAEHRDTLVAALTTTAERARLTNAIYAAAAFGEQAGVGPTWAGLVARVLAWPGGTGVEEFLTAMAAAARGDDTVTSSDVVSIGRRRLVLVRQRMTGDGGGAGGASGASGAGATLTSFIVPMRDRGVFVNLEFTSPSEPAPEHAFAHIVETLRIR